MFFRIKKVKGHKYLQLVENRWENGMPRQRVIASPGRVDELQEKEENRQAGFITCEICKEDKGGEGISQREGKGGMEAHCGT